MKASIFALSFLCLLFVTSASAQNVPVLNNNSTPLQMVEHPEHASVHSMQAESSLVSGTGYSYAQGEQPLWQFGSDKQEIPLGDVARAQRKQHAGDRKAVMALEK